MDLSLSIRQRSPIFLLMLVTIAVVALLTTGGFAHAVLSTSPLSYEDSFDIDEEGKNLSLPQFVYVDPVMDEVYIYDSKQRIIVYTSDNFPLFTHYIPSFMGLVVDENGRTYITRTVSEYNDRPKITVLNGCFQWERDILFEDFEGFDDEDFIPGKISTDNKGRLYISTINHGALIMDTDGTVLKVLAPQRNGRTVLLNNITLDSNGRVYLVSETQGRVYVYGDDWNPLFEFGEKGGSSGKLSRPRGIAVDDRNGNIYIVDYMRHAVNIYDKKGNFLFEFGGKGWSPGWFAYPSEVSIDQNGRVLVADLFNHRIQAFIPRTISEKPTELDIAGFSSGLFSTERHSYDNYFGDSLLRRLKTERRREAIQFLFP